MQLTIDDIQEAIGRLGGVVAVVSSGENGGPAGTWGDRFFFYDPDGFDEERKFPFATIVIQDFPGFDVASRLDREGVFRLNISIGKQACERLFGTDPEPTDPSRLDRLIPHPIYYSHGWVSVLNPGPESWEQVSELLAHAHAYAARRYERRKER